MGRARWNVGAAPALWGKLSVYHAGCVAAIRGVIWNVGAPLRRGDSRSHWSKGEMNKMRGTDELMVNAWKAGTVIPAFNVPYLPVMEPIVRALHDTRCFGLIAVARCEWEKFQARSTRAIFEEYQRVADQDYTRLHLDHVPVIDEDGLEVDYEAIITEAIEMGYQSVMVDGSRLALDENIAAVAGIVQMAHDAGIPAEAELGAVLGHEAGPLPPYGELYASGRGFTDPDEARRFVEDTGVDWLSVSVGNIHGAISGAAKSEKKVEARINIEHLDKIKNKVSRPLVLHGGSGIKKASILDGIKHGIAKINIGTTIRQAYEAFVSDSVAKAQDNVYNTAVQLIRDELEIEGSVDTINP